MGKVYSVSYDLNKSGKDYKGVWEELKKSQSYLHALESTWFIYTSETADQVYNRIKLHLDSDDKIIITQITKNMQGALPDSYWTWLDDHII